MDKMNEKLLNDLTKLNNELVNNKRKLEQKNKEISKLNDELERTQEDMQMYVYAMSHDLKEPVRMVKSFMDLFYKNYGDNIDEKGKRYIDFAVDGANRIEIMINGLLFYYKSTVNKIEVDKTVNLNDVLNESLNLLQLQIQESKAKIKFEKLPTVRGGETEWIQIFQNLISNAIKYTPQSRKPIINIQVSKLEDKWKLTVTDNGVGIDKKYFNDVFLLFKRLNNNKIKGTGIGLAVVKKNIESLGGSIYVESQLDKGTTFNLLIPRDK